MADRKTACAGAHIPHQRERFKTKFLSSLIYICTEMPASHLQWQWLMQWILDMTVMSYEDMAGYAAYKYVSKWIHATLVLDYYIFGLIS